MGQHVSVPASRSSSSGHGTNNLPPLLFHNVCGENIRISREGTVARRAESFCKGIAFSSRPIKVNEKICIKFLEISNNWSGVIRFGFSYNDPSTLRDGLPKYACPDLTNKPGYWAKALPERFCNQGTVLFYYVSASGDVHFGINNEEKGIFFSGVETRGPLWGLIDVYGNSTAIEFIDIRHQLNNARRSSTTVCHQQREDAVVIAAPSTVDVDRIICSTQNMNLHHSANIQQRELDCSAAAVEPGAGQLRYQSAGSQFVPMSLHRTRGRNIRFTNGSRCEAARLENEFCQGYVFTSHPLALNQTIVIQILASSPLFQGCLGLGLTSCDPSTLSPADLPDDSNFLLDRPEYWVISRDFARSLSVGDEVSFCVSERGEVEVRRNGAVTPSVVMHVDHTLRLWAVFDVYGGTRKIRVYGHQLQQTATPTRPLSSAISRGVVTPPNSDTSMNSINEQMMLLRRNTANNAATTPTTATQQRLTFSSADIQVQPSANGGAVLSVILPPPHASIVVSQSPQQQQQTVPYNHHQQQQQQIVPHASCSSSSSRSINHSVVNSNVIGSSNGSSVGLLTAAINNGNNTTSVVSLPQPISGSAAAAIVSSCSVANTYIEQQQQPMNCRQATPGASQSGGSCAQTASESATAQTWMEQNSCASAAQYSAGAECTICYENSIDAVLYMCGHMCMCYECALQQWRGKGGGHCPLCRALIRDVIRTYKS